MRTGVKTVRGLLFYSSLQPCFKSSNCIAFRAQRQNNEKEKRQSDLVIWPSATCNEECQQQQQQRHRQQQQGSHGGNQFATNHTALYPPCQKHVWQGGSRWAFVSSGMYFSQRGCCFKGKRVKQWKRNGLKRNQTKKDNSEVKKKKPRKSCLLAGPLNLWAEVFLALRQD